MNENPLVTVNILSFNRKDELRDTLTKVYEQDYKNIEVIVVDNASSDGSAEMVKNEFIEAQIIPLKSNEGAPGLNHGFRKSKGDFLLILDDDSFPLDGTIREGVEKLKSQKKIGIVAFEIFNTYLMKVEYNFILDKPYSFIGCGAMIRKELCHKLGGYNELYFLYHNELDFAALTLNLGYEIVQSNKRVIHNFSSLNRSKENNSPLLSRKRYYYFFISQSIFFIQRLKFSFAIRMMFKWLLNRMIIAARYNYYSDYFHALMEILIHLKKYIKTREILKNELQKKYLKYIAYVDRSYFPDFKKPSFLKYLN